MSAQCIKKNTRLFGEVPCEAVLTGLEGGADGEEQALLPLEGRKLMTCSLNKIA